MNRNFLRLLTHLRILFKPTPSTLCYFILMSFLRYFFGLILIFRNLYVSFLHPMSFLRYFFGLILIFRNLYVSFLHPMSFLRYFFGLILIFRNLYVFFLHMIGYFSSLILIFRNLSICKNMSAYRFAFVGFLVTPNALICGISKISLLLSVFYLILRLLYTFNSSNKLFVFFKKSKFFRNLAALMVVIARLFASLPDKSVTIISYISGSLLTTNIVLRSLVASGFFYLPLGLESLLYLVYFYLAIGLINTFFRVSVIFGSQLEVTGDSVNLILWEVWENLANSRGVKAAEQYFRRSEPPLPVEKNSSKLKNVGTISGIAGVAITAGIGYCTYHIMLDTARATNISERLANSTIATQQSTVENERVNTMAKYLKQRNEQDALRNAQDALRNAQDALRNEDKRLDQKAVVGGYMTSEDYAAKWNQWDKAASSGFSSCSSSFPS